MRVALTNSRIMVHQPSGGAQGMASDIEIQAREILRMRTRLNALYAKYTGQPIEAIEMAMDRDKFLEADEAKEFGIDRRSVRQSSRGRGRGHHGRRRRHACIRERAIRQAGALPYRRNGQGHDAQLEILLITSRQTRRWIIPKGNIDFLMSPHAAAAQEALEEAGAVGAISRQPIGAFRYCKAMREGSPVMAKVTVFPLEVVTLLQDWQESEWRLRRWFSQSAAADAVHEPELSKLIRSFWPRRTSP